MAAPRSCTASTLGPVDRQTSILNLPREVKDPIFRLESPVLSSVGREFVQHEGKAIDCVGAKPDLGAAGAGPPCGPPNPEARASPAGNPLSHFLTPCGRQIDPAGPRYAFAINTRALSQQSRRRHCLSQKSGGEQFITWGIVAELVWTVVSPERGRVRDLSACLLGLRNELPAFRLLLTGQKAHGVGLLRLLSPGFVRIGQVPTATAMNFYIVKLRKVEAEAAFHAATRADPTCILPRWSDRHRCQA
jgi:hypothetical protein